MKYAIYSDGSYKNGIWGAGAVILQETPFGLIRFRNFLFSE